MSTSVMTRDSIAAPAPIAPRFDSSVPTGAVPVPGTGTCPYRPRPGARHGDVHGRARPAFRKNGSVATTPNLGLEGVVAFETEIAEPDREGSALRYRGVDIEELGGTVPFERVWGLVVNESLDRGLPLPLPAIEPA